MDFVFFMCNNAILQQLPQKTLHIFLSECKTCKRCVILKKCETDFYAEQNSECSSSCLTALSTVTLGQYISH